MNNKFIFTILFVFAVLSGAFYGIQQQFPAFDLKALLIGNLMMLSLAILTFIIVKKKVHERPQAFVTGVYSATFLKLMVCLVAIVAYAMMNKATLHKPTLFMMFGIYVVYTAFETAMLMQLAKKDPSNKS